MNTSEASKMKSPPTSVSIVSVAPPPSLEVDPVDNRKHTNYCILNNGHVLLVQRDAEAPKNVREFLEPPVSYLDPIVEDTQEAGSYFQINESPKHFHRNKAEQDELELICEEDVSDIEN